MIEIVRLRPVHTEYLIRFFEAINEPNYTKDFSPHAFDIENATCVCNCEGQDLYFSIFLNGGEIIGYGIIRGWDEGFEIPSVGLCILKKYQRSGLGRMLLNFLETVARLKGCSEVMLKVKKDNEIAKRLYETERYVFKEYSDEFLIGFKKLGDK